MHRVPRVAVIAGSYILITLIFTWPAALQLTSHVIGAGGDPWQTLWRFEDTQMRVAVAWGDGTVGQLVRQEFLGVGEPRLVNLSAWPWLWLQVLAGQPLTYNLIWLTSFVLSGVSMFALMRYLLRQDSGLAVTEDTQFWSAWLAGLVYMLLPYHVAHALGHFGAMQTFWLPFLLLLLFSFLQRPRWATGILLAAAAGLQTWTEHHYGLWFCVAAVVVLIWQRKQVIELVKPAHRWAVLGVVVLAALLAVVPYWPTVREGFSETNTLVLGAAQTLRFSADPFAYVLPHEFHTLWGAAAATFFATAAAKNITEITHYVGLTLLLLVVFFHQRIPRTAVRLWGTLAVVFFVISLGPRLQLFDRVMPIPLPYALLDNLPVFNAVRSVGRASVMVGLAFAVLLGYVAATQFKRRASFVLVAGLVLIEFVSIPIPMQSAQLSPAYAYVATLPGTRLLEIPAGTNYTAASRALYASRVHGKEVLGGIALERGEASSESKRVRSLPALRHALYLGVGTLEENRPEFFDQALAETFYDAMGWQDIGAVVLHTDSVSEGQRSALEHFLLTEANFSATVYEDVSVLTPASTFPHDGVLFWRREGWDSVVYDEAQAVTLARITHAAEATVVNTRTTPTEVTLSFRLRGSAPPVITRTDTNERIELQSPGAGNVRVTLLVPPGETTLRFMPTGEELVVENPQFQTAPL